MPAFVKHDFKADDSVEDIMQKAGLNWEVEAVPLYMDINGKRKEAPRKALVRNDNYSVLSVTGAKWKPVYNRDVVGFFKRVMKESGAEFKSLGEVMGGKGIWAMAEVGSGFELKGGDKIEGNVIFCSYHEVGKATVAFTTGRRLWCDNQIAFAASRAGREKSHYRQSHISEFDFDAAIEAVVGAKDEITTFAKQAEKLQKIKLDEVEAHKFLAKHFVEEELSEEALDALVKDESQQPLALRQVLHSYVKAPGAVPGSAWGVLNAVTHWADHVAGSKPSARFAKAMFGQNAKLKEEVMHELLELA